MKPNQGQNRKPRLIVSDGVSSYSLRPIPLPERFSSGKLPQTMAAQPARNISINEALLPSAKVQRFPKPATNYFCLLSAIFAKC